MLDRTGLEFWRMCWWGHICVCICLLGWPYFAAFLYHFPPFLYPPLSFHVHLSSAPLSCVQRAQPPLQLKKKPTDNDLDTLCDVAGGLAEICAHCPLFAGVCHLPLMSLSVVELDHVINKHVHHWSQY